MKHFFIGLLIQFCTTVCFAQDMDLSGIKDFLYQLQNLDLYAVAQTGFDLVIIDYSADGDDETAYSASQIDALKHSPGGEKIILSYLSIGEAESYRFYWQKSWRPGHPVWLDEENPEWKENYKVRYWYSEWQTVIFSYLDRILSAGFDGVYMDLIDAYETYQHLSSIQSSQEMVNFVQAIKDYARSVDNDFLIFVQNGEELATIHPLYLNAVDGIGREDIYYGYEDDGKPTPVSVTEQMQTNLDVFLNAGKIVLTIDYPFAKSVDNPHYDAATLNKINDAYTKSRNRGYVPYCTVRELSYLTINQGVEPTDTQIEDRIRLFQLYQNYPNPFNQLTTISYQLSTGCRIQIHVFDALGRHKGTVVNEYQSSGMHRVVWDTDGLASGVYLCRIEAGDYRAVRKMGIMK